LVAAEDRSRFEAIVADRNCTQNEVIREQIVLRPAERLEVAEMAWRAGVGWPAVCRWQRCFTEAGIDGLVRDATREPAKLPLRDEVVRRVVALTCAEPPWRARPLSTVVVLLQQPDHARSRQLKPPAHATRSRDHLGAQASR
jgi:hypothetical protein